MKTLFKWSFVVASIGCLSTISFADEDKKPEPEQPQAVQVDRSEGDAAKKKDQSADKEAGEDQKKKEKSHRSAPNAEQRKQRVDAVFAKLDTNGDGSISKEEFAAAAEKRQQHAQATRERPVHGKAGVRGQGRGPVHHRFSHRGPHHRVHARYGHGRHHYGHVGRGHFHHGRGHTFAGRSHFGRHSSGRFHGRSAYRGGHGRFDRGQAFAYRGAPRHFERGWGGPRFGEHRRVPGFGGSRFAYRDNDFEFRGPRRAEEFSRRDHGDLQRDFGDRRGSGPKQSGEIHKPQGEFHKHPGEVHKHPGEVRKPHGDHPHHMKPEGHRPPVPPRKEGEEGKAKDRPRPERNREEKAKTIKAEKAGETDKKEGDADKESAAEKDSENRT